MSASFWNLIFGAEKGGYVRVALNTKDKKFNQEFVEWPAGLNQLDSITKAREKGDIYFCPALFKEKDGKKASVLGSRVGWVDLDQKYEEKALTTIKPNAVVASGTPGRAHLYFQLPTLFPKETLEVYNRYLVKEFGGDNSGWDANQLLRVPDTLNWKTTPPKQVKLLQLDPSQHWSLPKLDEISEPDNPLQLESADLGETLLDSRISPTIRSLLTQGTLECFDRSASLYRLAALTAEAGLEPNRIYTLLEFADSRWGKFSQRDDKQLRLIEIVKRVSQSRFSASFPSEPGGPQNERRELVPVGIYSLRKQAPPANWVVDSVIRENGLTLIGGPTNIGKSPLAMSLAMAVAVGSSDWMGFNIKPNQDQRILWSALEMDESEVNEQVSPMLDFVGNSPILEAKLEQNLHILPVGYSIPADLKEGQEFYEGLLEEHGYTGLVLDTIGASVSTSLSEEKQMRAIVDWLARTRKRFGIWIVVLSHPRKDPAGGKFRDKEMDDFYGSRLIGDRSNVAIIMDKTKEGGLQLMNKKARFGKSGDKLLINRMDNGWYSVGERVPSFTASIPGAVGKPASDEDGTDVDVNKPDGAHF